MTQISNVFNVVGKGSIERTVLLSDEAIKILKKYIEIRHQFLGKIANTYLFCRPNSNTYITRQVVFLSIINFTLVFFL